MASVADTIWGDKLEPRSYVRTENENVVARTRLRICEYTHPSISMLVRISAPGAAASDAA